MGNEDTRNLALVGCGYWGKNLARNFNEIGALHTICENQPDQIKALKEQYPDVQMEADYSAVLANPSIHQIAIAAPAVQHYEIAKAALQADKDVYVEKPICLNVSEAEYLAQMADTSSRILMVGHLLQYHPAICQIQKWIADGVLGKVFRVTSTRLNLGKIRTEENAFWSLAPHDISIALSLFPDAPPSAVQSVAKSHLNEGITDWANTTLFFSGNQTAQIQSSWLHPFKEQKLCIIGEKAMAVFDDTLPWSAKLSLWKDYLNGGKKESITLEEAEPLRKECLHFLDCCQTRKMPKTDGWEGVRVLKVMETAQKSADADGLKTEV